MPSAWSKKNSTMANYLGILRSTRFTVGDLAIFARIKDVKRDPSLLRWSSCPASIHITKGYFSIFGSLIFR